MNEGKYIYFAIPAILADVDAIGKNRNNSQQGYKFRGIDDVYNAIHPLLAKHKVFPTCEILSRELTEKTTAKGTVLFYVNIKAKYTLWAQDGSNVTTEAWGEAMDSGDKASNKAMSAAYKYALFQLLCIPTEAVDSEEETHKDIQATKPAAKKPEPKAEPQKTDFAKFTAALLAAETCDAVRKLVGVIDKKDATLEDKDQMYGEAFRRYLSLEGPEVQWAKSKLDGLRRGGLITEKTMFALTVELEKLDSVAV